MHIYIYTPFLHCISLPQGHVWMCMELLDSSMADVASIVYNQLKQCIPEKILGKMSVAVRDKQCNLHCCQTTIIVHIRFQNGYMFIILCFVFTFNMKCALNSVSLHFTGSRSFVFSSTRNQDYSSRYMYMYMYSEHKSAVDTLYMSCNVNKMSCSSQSSN